MTVLAAKEWRTNGELIADVARLYIDIANDLVLDPTWGKGNWWTVVKPRHFLASDHKAAQGRTHHAGGLVFRWKFEALPIPDAEVDVVAFDPPYVAMGGRTTSTLNYTDGTYGMHDAPSSPAEVRDLIASGLIEAKRVLKRGGRLLVKCQDYVSSGSLCPGTHWALSDALALGGLRYVDRFEHIGPPRPQPGGRRQLHARRNLSTLLVFTRSKP